MALPPVWGHKYPLLSHTAAAWVETRFPKLFSSNNVVQLLALHQWDWVVCSSFYLMDKMMFLKSFGVRRLSVAAVRILYRNCSHQQLCCGVRVLAKAHLAMTRGCSHTWSQLWSVLTSTPCSMAQSKAHNKSSSDPGVQRNTSTELFLGCFNPEHTSGIFLSCLAATEGFPQPHMLYHGTSVDATSSCDSAGCSNEAPQSFTSHNISVVGPEPLV